MSVITDHTIKSLETFREGLLAINKNDLNHKAIMDYAVNNRKALDLNSMYNAVTNRLLAFQTDSDPEILDAARYEVIDQIDRAIVAVGTHDKVRSILDDLILRVRDTKLATLLNEFNAAKDGQPNLAAIGLRTIICLMIQERAKAKDSKSKLAIRPDLVLDPMLEEAIGTGLFPQGETKLLKAFQSHGQKAMFDNIVHKPGSNMLVSKDALAAGVDLLNKLLPTLE